MAVQVASQNWAEASTLPRKESGPIPLSEVCFNKLYTC